MPHQALREFWRHRQRAQGSPRGATKAATDALSKSAQAMSNALTTWAKAVGVDDDELSALTGRVDGFLGSLRETVQELLHDADAERAGDPILEQLEELLAGKVTQPLTSEEHAECVAEANRRIENELPPGYKDAHKEDADATDGGTGDYLVWYQATRYAQQQGKDLILVTRDEKEDWWWRQQSEFIGPRPELALEYYELSGRRLFLMRPADLLSRASVLEVEVDQESSLDAERVTDEEEDPDPVVAAWTRDAVAALLDLLDVEAPVQANALRLATPDRGGRVTREEVYALGNYDDDRMLRGFTRPFRRLTDLLQRKGVVPAGVPQIFVARYPDGVKTSYFSVPEEVPTILAELRDRPPA